MELLTFLTVRRKEQRKKENKVKEEVVEESD